MKRLLECVPSELAALKGQDLKNAMAQSGGRVLACEVDGGVTPVLGDVTNAEFASAMGADIIILNKLDVQNPVVQALPDCPPAEVLQMLKDLTGRLVGVNLEAVADAEDALFMGIAPGRLATADNALTAAGMGADLIVLTGNPGSGVSSESLQTTLRTIRPQMSRDILLAAGTMHVMEGDGEQPAQDAAQLEAEALVRAGADIVLFPAPGTAPGAVVEETKACVAACHALGALCMTAVGTSQEGADTGTIRQIALWAKMTGADIHFLGDSGLPGMAMPENITAYSMAIRGFRHTYRRMAASILR